MKGVISKTVRKVKITTSKAIPYLTDPVNKQDAILTNDKGDTVKLSDRQMTKDLQEFFENSGLTLEYVKSSQRTGKTKINGIPVKVLPVTHGNYEGGAIILVEDESPMSYDNINTVLNYLNKHDVNIAKECVLLQEMSQEGACVFKGATA